MRQLRLHQRPKGFGVELRRIIRRAVNRMRGHARMQQGLPCASAYCPRTHAVLLPCLAGMGLGGKKMLNRSRADENRCVKLRQHLPALRHPLPQRCRGRRNLDQRQRMAGSGWQQWLQARLPSPGLRNGAGNNKGRKGKGHEDEGYGYV